MIFVFIFINFILLENVAVMMKFSYEVLFKTMR